MRIPLFGTGVSSGQNQVTVRKTVGMYWERRGETEKSPMVAVPFPGHTTFATMATDRVRALAAGPTTSGGSVLYVMANNKAYRVALGTGPTPGTITELGTLAVSDGTAEDIAVGTDGKVLFVDNGSMFFWDGATWTGVTPDFNARTCTWIGGYWVASDAQSNRFYVSSDGTTWTDFASAEAAPDTIVALRATRNELYVFGYSTTEVWAHTGNSDFPFERVSGATSSVGCVTSGAAAMVAGVPYFVARAGDGQAYVARMEGYTPVPISTDDINRHLPSPWDAGHQVQGFGFTWNGHPMYQLTRGGSTAWTKIYDAATGLWTDVTDATAHVATVGCEVAGGVIGGAVAGGDFNLYRYSATAHNLPKRQIITDHVVSPDGERFTVDSLRLDMATNMDAAEKQVKLKVSRDGGLSWGAEQSVGLGTTTGPQKKVEFRRLGTARSFTFDLSFPTDVPLTVHSASINASD